MANALLSIVVEGTDHALKIEAILEQKAKDVTAAQAAEAAAIANAVTPDLEAGIKALTTKLASIRKLHETAAGFTANAAPPAPAAGAM